MSDENIVESQTSFGLNLLATLPTDTSQVFSPLSISLGLSLVHSGAHGATKEQLEKSLLGENGHFLEEHFTKVIGELTNENSLVKTSIANRVFANRQFPINKEYLEKVEKTYNASAKSLDFNDSEKAAGEINKFVEESTCGKIKNLISSDSLKDAFALLVNAVYFKGQWLEKFESPSTLERDFHKGEGDVRQIPFLNELECHRDYTENETFQVLSLPYEDTNFNFVIFLPKVKFGLADALKTLNGSSFHHVLRNLASSYLNVHIPKMHIKTEISLRENLEKVGITEIFSDSADISGIAPGIKISSGIHKSIIEVDEEGTTAAASTAIKARLEMMLMSEPKLFIADHPFLFALLHNNSPIFLGTHY